MLAKSDNTGLVKYNNIKPIKRYNMGLAKAKNNDTKLAKWNTKPVKSDNTETEKIDNMKPAKCNDMGFVKAVI